MNRKDRYDATGLPEAQHEPGSRGRVLRNMLGITRVREMERIESLAQVRALEKFSLLYGPGHRFTATDIRDMHRTWLGEIYPWAGNDRNVQMSKGGFPFAAVQQIPKLMLDLEAGPLRHMTPCRYKDRERVVRALAEVHVELLIIHPFRDGNGRLARMLSVLMGLQAGLPPLDFSGIKGKEREQYFAAVRAGLDRNYKPMEQVFEKVIARTLRVSPAERASSSKASPPAKKA